MDLDTVMKNLQAMTKRAREIQTLLKHQVAEGVAAGGMVKARVNGLGDLVGLELEREVIHPEDPEMLADLIVAAIHAAKRNAAHLRTEAMREVLGGIDPSVFGIDWDTLLP